MIMILFGTPCVNYNSTYVLYLLNQTGADTFEYAILAQNNYQKVLQ